MPPKARKSPAPAGIGAAGRRLWDDVTRQVADDGLELDARDKRLLRDASFTADDLARLEIALGEAPVSMQGSMGQTVPNRLWDETRKARALISQLLRQLDLDDPEAAVKGSGSSVTSTSARAAASVRWHGASGIGHV